MTELERLLSQDDSCLISVASVKRALKQDSKKEKTYAVYEERIEADLYFEWVDLTHWKVYVNEVNENSYWLICERTMKEAIKRFKSFSVYKPKRTYVNIDSLHVLPKEAK